MTALTPPTAPPLDAPEPAAPERPAGDRVSRPARSVVVSVVAVVLGALVLVGSLVSGAAQTVFASPGQDQSSTIAVAGVTAIDVDARAGSLRVVFADVDEASLEVRDGRSGWGFERSGDQLRVTSPDGGRFGLWFGSNGRATLTLPETLAGVDARMRVAAGALAVDGTYGELDLRLGAGSLTATGEARSLSASVDAGSAELELSGVEEARLAVSAGEMRTRLRGPVPSDVGIEVSAGSLDLTLPDGDYDVRSDVSAGGLDNRLRASPGDQGAVQVQIGAGSVTLRTGD